MKEEKKQQSNDNVEEIEKQNNNDKKHPHEDDYSQIVEYKRVSFWEKNRSILINIISCTISVILIILTLINFNNSQPPSEDSNHTDITQTTVRVETSFYTEKIKIASDAIYYYMNPENDLSSYEVYKAYEKYKDTLNIGLPLNFKYSVTGLPLGVNVQSAILEISENDNYQDALTYTLDLDKSSLDIYNLKTGTNYYYRVNLTLDKGSVIGTTGAFETEKSPRILNIDGIVNVRDIGGWKTSDGSIIKQGLLYRGSETDGAVHQEYKITDRGLQQMMELGIKFDMDLRAESEKPSGIKSLGENVARKYYGIQPYAPLFKNKEKLREIFSDLSNPDNYPIYLHCTYGRDRTGSVCYLLEALLGVSENDLRKEYEISGFTSPLSNTDDFDAFVDKINTFSGDTTQEKVEGYLLSIGVTAEEIANIREIFLKK